MRALAQFRCERCSHLFAVGAVLVCAAILLALPPTAQADIFYLYDTADRLMSITQGTGVTTFGYDNANRRTALTLPSGVTTTYAYDAASQLTGLSYTLGPTTLGTLLYGYDTRGSRTVIGGTWARTGLPPALASATYNAANHQLTFGSQALAYDLNGNLTSDGASTYTWDVRNRLAAIMGPSPASFLYDGAGRRRAKTVSGTTTTFLYDDLNPVQEQAGSSIRNLLTGLRVDEFLTRDDGAGARGLLGDALGSTLALVEVGGTIAATYTYDPFGTTTVTGSPGPNMLTYTGREDDGTGLKYYRARYYHPGLQRFVSEDPIGFAGSDVSLYVYVRNSPLIFVDPHGLEKERRECWDEDYATFSAVLFPIPRTKGFFSVTAQITVDRYGNLYFGVGGSAARGVSRGRSAALMRGFVDDPTGGERVPSEARLRGFIEGWGTTAIVAAGPAVGRAWSAGGGTAREVGWGVPQAGFTGGRVFRLGKTQWISPLSGCGG